MREMQKPGPVKPPYGPTATTAAPTPTGSGEALITPPAGTMAAPPIPSPRPTPASASKAPGQARRARHARQAPREKPVSVALAAAKEKALRIGHEFREQFSESLTREDYIRVARAFGSAVVPKRKPGRRRKPQVTAALADFKAGMRGVALFQKHIPSWDKHGEWRRKAEARALMDAIRSRDRRERGRRMAC